MKEQLFKLIFFFEQGAISNFEIIEWAMNQLAEENMSESVTKLASLNSDEKEVIKALFKEALEDMGYSYPSKQALGLYQAKLISEGIIKGKVSPLKGCAVLSRIFRTQEGPDLLAVFDRLNRWSSELDSSRKTDELTQEIVFFASSLSDNVNAYLKLKS